MCHKVHFQGSWENNHNEQVVFPASFMYWHFATEPIFGSWNRVWSGSKVAPNQPFKAWGVNHFSKMFYRTALSPQGFLQTKNFRLPANFSAVLLIAMGACLPNSSQIFFWHPCILSVVAFWMSGVLESGLNQGFETFQLHLSKLAPSWG